MVINKAEMEEIYEAQSIACTTPKAHVRNWEEERSKRAFARCLEHTVPEIIRDEDLIGMNIIYMRNENFGSKKYPDVRKVFTEETISRVTAKMIFARGDDRRINRTENRYMIVRC